MKLITAGVQGPHHRTVACSTTKVREMIEISSQRLTGLVQMKKLYLDFEIMHNTKALSRYVVSVDVL